MPESPIACDDPPADPAGRFSALALVSLAELLAMTLWFGASASAPQIQAEWDVGPSQGAWLTLAVQVGFVVGAVASALANVSDRTPAPRLVAGSALAGAAFNAAMVWLPVRLPGAVALRFATGFALAGVYPPGMKIAASWFRRGRGFALGVLIGALVLGNATPHLLHALPVAGASGHAPWRAVLLATSGLAVLGAVIAGVGVRVGPFLPAAAPFDWRFVGRALAHRPTRLANLGYLGHMWELYAMWVWTPLLLLDSYQRAGWSPVLGRVAGFATIAVGALGCVVAGRLADRLGRTLVAGGSLAVSGTCCVVAATLTDRPGLLTLVCLVWGFAVVADSAQFSAAVSELTDPRYVGTALTLQTSLGFLLTLVTIRGVPALLDAWGWSAALPALALGPVCGIVAMARLRGLPEAARMASGRR